MSFREALSPKAFLQFLCTARSLAKTLFLPICGLLPRLDSESLGKQGLAHSWPLRNVCWGRKERIPTDLGSQDQCTTVQPKGSRMSAGYGKQKDASSCARGSGVYGEMDESESSLI